MEPSRQLGWELAGRGQGVSAEDSVNEEEVKNIKPGISLFAAVQRD